jgi:hypothetical protein
MLQGSDTRANHWLRRLESALAQKDAGALGTLFEGDSHWRDVLAFTWRIQTVSGKAEIIRQLLSCSATGFRTDPDRTPPRHVTRAGEKCIETIFASRPRRAIATASCA